MKLASCVIVVPCYNEADRLDPLAFLRFARAASDIRFILVDDGSTDGTWQSITRLSAERPDQFQTIRLPSNLGKGEAVRQGLLAAMASETECVGYWDADLATPLDTIHRFRDLLERSPWLQAVIGSRVQLLGRHIERRALRHYVGRVFATAASLVLGLRVYDTQCGAKLFRVTPTLAAVLARPFRCRWIFDVEVLARLVVMLGDRPLSAAAVIYEEPLDEWCDVGGSRLRVWHYAGAAIDLGRIWLERVRSSQPKSPRPPGVPVDAHGRSHAGAGVHAHANDSDPADVQVIG